LTGSADIQTLPNTQESLAGRVAKIRLRCLTEGEILGAKPKFLQRCFNQNFRHKWKPYNRDRILEAAFRGGYPEVISLDGRARRRWHRDYISALLERDLRDIARIRQHDAMKELVKVMAAWSSRFMDITAIGAGLSIRRPTLESYINALEALYLVERVQPWTRTDYARVGRQKKLFLTDSGLMGSILGWRLDQVRLDSDRVGKLVESFAFGEIAALVDMSDGECDLYHYRDNLAGDRPFIGIVLYAGEHAGSFSDGLWAVPFGAMWG
jgi:predicted AAA+ superfamily ATPase